MCWVPICVRYYLPVLGTCMRQLPNCTKYTTCVRYIPVLGTYLRWVYTCVIYLHVLGSYVVNICLCYCCSSRHTEVPTCAVVVGEGEADTQRSLPVLLLVKVKQTHRGSFRQAAAQRTTDVRHAVHSRPWLKTRSDLTTWRTPTSCWSSQVQGGGHRVSISTATSTGPRGETGITVSCLVSGLVANVARPVHRTALFHKNNFLLKKQLLGKS